MGARRRRINKQIVFGEEPDQLPDPFQSDANVKTQKYRDTQASQKSILAAVVSATLFLALCGWAILLVVHHSVK